MVFRFVTTRKPAFSTALFLVIYFKALKAVDRHLSYTTGSPSVSTTSYLLASRPPVRFTGKKVLMEMLLKIMQTKTEPLYFSPPAAPFCGTYNFVYGGATYSNLGCSTTPYLYTAILVSDFTSANGTSSSASPTVDIVTQPSSVTVTVTPTNPIVAVASSGPGSSPTTAGSATSGASDQNPSKNSHKSDAGAIAGGVVGGVAAVAIVALLAWLLLRRRKNAANKAEAQEIAAGAAASAASEGAFHSVVANGQHAELAGKPTGTAGYVPVSQEIPQHEKPAGGDPQATEYYKPGAPQEHYGYSPQGGHPDAGAPSPPPIYNTPSPAVSGVSPVAAQHSPHTSELSSNPAFHQVPQNSPPVAGQLQAPQVPELGGTNQAAYQVPPNVSELGTASMAASLATQAPARRPVGGRQQFDMSGAPMTDEYRHELE